MNSNNKMSGWMNPDFISETEKNHKVFFSKNIKKFRELGNTPKEVNGKTPTDSEVVDFLVDTTRINMSVYRDLLTIVPSIKDNRLLDSIREVHGLSNDSMSDDNSMYDQSALVSDVMNTMTELLFQFSKPKNVDHYRSTLTRIYSTITSLGDSILSYYSSDDPTNVQFFRNILWMCVQDDLICFDKVTDQGLSRPEKVMSFVHDFVLTKKDEPTICLYLVLSICGQDIKTHFQNILDKYPPDNRDNYHFHQFCWNHIYKSIPDLDKEVFIHDWTNYGLDILGKFQVKMDQLLRRDIKTSRQIEVIRYDKFTFE